MDAQSDKDGNTISIKQEVKPVKHARSKSQTIVAMNNSNSSAETELSRHFERSLNRHYHAKSKSLPRPMRGI